jgi:hypothetical protein
LQNFLTDDKLVRHIEWTIAIMLVAVTLGAWVFISRWIAFAAFLGGVIACVSFEVLKWQIKRAFRNPRQLPKSAGLFASYYLRFLGTLFIIFTVIYYGWVNPIAFLAGLSIVPVSMVLVGVKEFALLLAKKGGS